MGINDRDYIREVHPQRPQMRYARPPITPVVKWLLIVNVAIYILEYLLVYRLGLLEYDYFLEYGSVLPVNLATSLQVWRLITYQFLHGNTFHLLF